MTEKKETPKVQNANRSEDMFYVDQTLSQKLFADCKLNPGHAKITPIKKFTLDHLPQLYRIGEMLELVKIKSNLTTLIKVKYTSPKRPKSVSCLEGQYPGYEMRGSDVLRPGTGFVVNVDIHNDTSAYMTCRCKNCREEKIFKPCGEINVITARHVVFDESEAKMTRCVLGFDENTSTVVNLDEWEVDWADSESDRCALRYFTCDMNLLNRLDKDLKLFGDLCVIVNDKCKEFVDKDRLAVMVSHPHGCPKHVTIKSEGPKPAEDEKSKPPDVRNVYKEFMKSVCQGSGGANVFRPRDNRKKPEVAKLTASKKPQGKRV